MIEVILNSIKNNGLITAFAVIGITMYISHFVSVKFTKGRVHGSAIAILIGLILAYFGGLHTGGQKGLADIQMFSGIGLMGGGMLRDFAIVATVFGAKFEELKKVGLIGVVSILVGTVVPFVIGVVVAYSFGYRDPVSLTTIGAGAITYIVGPVTGAAIGANSTVMALSIAAGVIKSICVMISTPYVAKAVGLTNPRTAVIFGGAMGTASGVAGGLAATNPRLVPYGAMGATFHTGVGCLLCPSILFIATKLIFG
ncbi:malonate transporter subunit MadM [Neobacillus sp. PS3-12]|jgi:malonate transporter MadM subunit|uniref:malonate transporter subunit MadM n=1 Tax=Neobacillus sp. PS3-12 TaxID=3070677 RepID=UPI0027DFE5C9|nr:malonate transporter subunit MadM [Neobacillus sp. PS3-12]WML52538.1 malonate transporter subunit MadM [Neobacillus sp. PS3-12]